MKQTEAERQKEIHGLKISLRKRDLSIKKLTEEYESKRASFNLVMNAKKEEIEKMKAEKYNAGNIRVLELEKDIANLKTLYNEKEAEILGYKEREFELIERHEKEISNLEKRHEAILNESNEELAKLKDQLFFSLALSFKLDSSKTTDLNLLYEKCKEDMVPVEMWTTWISQFVNENKREEGEEENVEHF